MTGKRLFSFRQGDLAEGCGIQLIRPFCAVAPISREEDFGNDCVATLLQRDEDLLIPGESFFIQFKSVSTKKIEYKKKSETEWFQNLSLPIFFGRVNLKKNKISIYTTFDLVNQKFNNYDSISMYFRERRDIQLKDSHLQANLGPPILEWSHEDIYENDPLDVHKILTKWIEYDKFNRRNKNINTRINVKWNTNQPPEYQGKETLNWPGELENDIDSIQPYMIKIAQSFISPSSRVLNFEKAVFIAFSSWLAKHGATELEAINNMQLSELLPKNSKKIKFQFELFREDNKQFPKISLLINEE